MPIGHHLAVFRLSEYCMYLLGCGNPLILEALENCRESNYRAGWMEAEKTSVMDALLHLPTRSMYPTGELLTFA